MANKVYNKSTGKSQKAAPYRRGKSIGAQIMADASRMFNPTDPKVKKAMKKAGV